MRAPILLSEELTLRENSRIKTALRMGRLAAIKTLAGFDFTFQPSLDRDRIFTLAQLGFVDRHEAVHFLGPPGTGKSHLATALGVEAVKAGKSVYFTTLADLIGSLARSEREGRLQERIRFFCRPRLLIVDEIGYLPVVQGGGNLFFQLVNARYERGAMILTSNRGFAEWGDVFGDPVVATARRTIASFEAMLWLRKGFGFTGDWTVKIRTTCSRGSSDFKKLRKREVHPIQRQTAGRT